jgi:hypothetical protein
VRVASSLSAVRERVIDFIWHNNPRSVEIRERVLVPMQNIGDTYIIGGLVRDLAFFGLNDRPISDIDIVVCCNPRALAEFSKKIGAQKNRFGGYAATIGGARVDYWSLSATWAHRNGHVIIRRPRDLIKSTFFDWDAIIFDVKRKKIHADSNYLHRMMSRIVDINLEPTPSSKGNLVRALRRLVMWDARPARALRSFIEKTWKNYSWAEICDAESRAFTTQYLTAFSTAEHFSTSVLDRKSNWVPGLDDRRQSEFDFLSASGYLLASGCLEYDLARLVGTDSYRSNAGARSSPSSYLSRRIENTRLPGI